jgi:hypothetical protein
MLMKLTSGFNFTHILQAGSFTKGLYVFTVWVCNNFLAKEKSVQKLFVKCWWNWLHVSISSTLNARIFVRTSFRQLFYLHTSYILRKKLPKWRLCKKCADIMLMKLTVGVNFINVLCTNFSYKRRFGSLEFGFEQTFVQKMCAKNVDEIDGRNHHTLNSSSKMLMKNRWNNYSTKHQTFGWTYSNKHSLHQELWFLLILVKSMTMNLLWWRQTVWRNK